MMRLADHYWRGDPSANPSFEYATKAVKVIAVEDELSPVAPSRWAEALERVAAYDKKPGDE